MSRTLAFLLGVATGELLCLIATWILGRWARKQINRKEEP